MSIIPVMGSALISPYKLASQRSGALLLLDVSVFGAVPAGVKATSATPAVVDWIHSDLLLVHEICEKAGLKDVDGTRAEQRLREYITANPGLPENWIRSTFAFVGL